MSNETNAFVGKPVPGGAGEPLFHAHVPSTHTGDPTDQLMFREVQHYYNSITHFLNLHPTTYVTRRVLTQEATLTAGKWNGEFSGIHSPF